MAERKMGKSIANRIQVGDYFAAAIETHATPIAATLKQIYREVPGLELTPSQIEPFIRALSSLLLAATRDLDQKETDYLKELDDDAEPRAMRDEQSALGSEMLQRAKELVSAAAGEEVLGRYGLDASFPRVPREVAKRMKTTIHLLGQHPFRATDRLGTVFDSRLVGEKLQEVYGALTKALEAVEREEQERQQAIEARDEAIEAWSDIYQGVATTMTGLYRLAGRLDLADLFKPTASRVAGRSEVPEPRE